MLLAFDIGNTSIVAGGFEDDSEPRFVGRFPSRLDLSDDWWRQTLSALVEAAGFVEGCVLCSVVPELAKQICPILQDLTKRSVLMIDANFDDGIVLAGYNRQTLGNDRIADIAGALSQYRPPFIIFDFGTATTLSVVDKKNRFLGGVIFAGMRLSVDALAAHTAQLPAVTLRQPKTLLGSDTVSCIRSGILYGAAIQVDGFSQRVEEYLHQSVQTIVTGGSGKLVIPLCRRNVIFDEHLLLKGLRSLYLRHIIQEDEKQRRLKSGGMK